MKGAAVRVLLQDGWLVCGLRLAMAWSAEKAAETQGGGQDGPRGGFEAPGSGAKGRFGRCKLMPLAARGAVLTELSATVGELCLLSKACWVHVNLTNFH